ELARRTPHIQEDLADEVFGERGVANDAKDEAVDPNVVARIKDVHRGPVAVGDAFQKHFVRGRLSSNDALTGSGVDGDDVLHDPAPSDAARAALRCRSVNEATFRDVCSKGRKWFLGQENCFVGAVPTKQLRQNCEFFQWRKMSPFRTRQGFFIVGWPPDFGVVHGPDQGRKFAPRRQTGAYALSPAGENK